MHRQELDVDTLREAIWHFVRPTDALTATGRVRRTSLAHCFRGNRRFKGTLWAVFQWHTPDDRGDLIPQPPVIYAITLQYISKKWTYRYYAEEEGPYLYNCPLSYLSLAPELCFDWRQAVRQWATFKSQQRKPRARLKSSL